MSDWFSTAIEMQREILRAQQAQIDAAQKMTALQQAGQKAVEANIEAWRKWAALWGWK